MSGKVLIAVLALVITAGLIWDMNPANAQVVTDGLISYWTFDEGDIEDDIVEDIIGGQNATMMGNPRIVDGKIGNALEFNGTTDYLLVTDDINVAKLPEGEMTAEVWVYPRHFIEWGGYIGAFQDNGGFEKGWVLGTNNLISFAVSTEGADDGDGVLTYLTASAFGTEEWYHVVGTYDGEEMKIYVNGKLERTSRVQSGNINYPDHLFFCIGVYRDDNEDFKHMGMLDEVRLYNRALTEDEIMQNYEAEGLSVSSNGKLSVTWGEIRTSVR